MECKYIPKQSLTEIADNVKARVFINEAKTFETEEIVKMVDEIKKELVDKGDLNED